MADSYISVIRFVGSTTGVFSGEVSVGKNDIDSVKVLDGMGDMTEGTVLSVHDDAGAAYQNLSGFNAVAVLRIEARGSGFATRHVRVYSGPTTNDITGATLLWEVGQVDSAFFDLTANVITTSPLTISNNHYLIVENVDDSRTGTNDIRVSDQANNAQVTNFVVERGA